MKYLKSTSIKFFVILCMSSSSMVYASDYQDTICDLWGFTVKSQYDNYEALKESAHNDPIAYIKKITDYEEYEPNSAGGLMLQVMIKGIETNQEKEKTKQAVMNLCKTFPENAIDSSNEADDLSSFN